MVQYMWRPRKPESSLGRTAQDGHLDSHTAPDYGDAPLFLLIFKPSSVCADYSGTGPCTKNCQVAHLLYRLHTPSIAFRRLPPNSARFSYATFLHSLSTRSCQPTRSASSEKFGYFGVTKYGSGWRKDVVNLCLEFVPALVSFLWALIRSAAGNFKEVAVTDQKTPLSLWPGRSLPPTGHAGTMAFQSLSTDVSGPAKCHSLRKPLSLKIRHKNIYNYHWGAVWKSRWPYWAPRP